ncbi:MAG: VOC family protein [Promethearchaeota archaeon]
MKIEHIALASNSEAESDKFFIDLLGLEKTRSFIVAAELMEKFFGINKEHKVIRYSKNELDIEVFITRDDSKVRDIFTHNCLLVNDPEELVNNANSMGFVTIKVPRKNGGNYFFIKDSFANLFELKKIK